MVSSFIAYCVIPAYTLIFVRNSDWLASNLSVIGSWPGRRVAFFFLGLLVGTYYLVILRRLLSRLPRHMTESLLLWTAFALLMLAVSTPYLPETVPFQAFLHVVFAFTSSILLALCLWLTFRHLSGLSPELMEFLRPYRMSMAVIGAVCTALLLIAGIISTAMELYFLVTTIVLVQKAYIHLNNPAGEALPPNRPAGAGPL